jgi:pyruvate kinase
MTTKRTKIVATLGPASSDKKVLTEMITAGVNVCRLNFSHGSHEDHAKAIKIIQEINDELGTHVATLADLQGPKIRVGVMEGEGVELINGKQIIITNEECVGTAERISVQYKQLPADVRPGENILLDDGKLMLRVIDTDFTTNVKAEVIHGGILSSKKGINLPNTKISLPSLTPKDREDLEFALEHNVDWVGLSFVRNARDIIELKHIISQKGNNARVIAKIEKPEAVDEMEEIIIATDAVMVARGDLGVEIPMEKVPMIQKEIIKVCQRYAKPVIVATQMMESMITSISPTRAEVNDVANAVLDGADAVMLSGETSVGKFPVQVIQAMTKIVEQVELSDTIYNNEAIPEKNQDRFITDSICFNACRLANRVEAQAIVTMTFSGYTAYKISSQRPKSEIMVFTANKKILNQLNLVWGVKGFFYDKMVSTDHTVADIKFILKKKGMVRIGDLVINVASTPIGDKGKSNMLKLSYVE